MVKNVVKNCSLVSLVWGVVLFAFLLLFFAFTFYGAPMKLPELTRFFEFGGGVDVLLLGFGLVGLIAF